MDPKLLDSDEVDKTLTSWGQTLDDTITQEQARRLREIRKP